MAKNCDHTFLTQHLGTEQTQRSRNPLMPEKLFLNEFSTEDWMRFAYTFAENLNYFDTNNASIPDGDWTRFFIEKDVIASFLKEHEGFGTMKPHLTLFVCFLKLLEFTQQHFNTLTKRHVDFYYQQILQIDKKKPIEDSVHLIFELAKNTHEAQVKSGTKTLANKDLLGNNRIYVSNTETVINQAQVTSLKSIYHHRANATGQANEYNSILAAPVVNSEGGSTTAFTNNEPWLPFGYPSFVNEKTKLPTASLGFALGAPILALQEGERTITVTISLSKDISVLSTIQLNAIFEIYATGEEGWIGPLEIYKKTPAEKATTSTKSLQFVLKLDTEMPAITKYTSKIHESSFKDEVPMLSFQLKTEQPQYKMGYDLYTQLLDNIMISVEISVQVHDVVSLKLQNDLGPVKANKPFYPFGTQPVKNSSFVVDYPEAFSKKWNNVSIKGTWLDQPTDFVQHYIAYRKKGNNINLSPNQYYQVLYFKDNQTPTGTNSDGKLTPTTGNNNLYVQNNNHFTTKISANGTGDSLSKNSAHQLFGSSGTTLTTGITLNNTPKHELKGPLKLTLNQSFLHTVYPKVLALSMGSEQDTHLPNAPYTPQLEKLTLNYSASEKREFGKNAPVQATITVHHLHPFGHALAQNTLVPRYCQGGNLYIGLSNTLPQQQVNMLFQFLEGTENPEVASFSTTEKIRWSYLQNNQWIDLTSENLVGDTTDNFLKTGIVSVIIPKENNTENTLLPNGNFWLRAKNPKRFDAVCTCIAVHSQAVTATFQNNENEVSHLATGLPAKTIAKLVQRNPLVKKVTQPFASFGGTPEETDSAYYQRISERLRHKDRAITLWDYEHLILEEFTDVHKVKCLNHTKGSSYHAAGFVTLVTIPDIVNNNAFDIFKPRLSTAKRNEIGNYINKLNSHFVTAQVVNPQYEEVKVSLGVKLKEGYDPNFYEKETERAIQKYLSPWAYTETAQLNFGISFHESNLIEYLEQQPYVAYLTDVVVKHYTIANPNGLESVNILPSNPQAILVSAKSHTITVVTLTCKTPVKTTPSVCLP